MAGVFLRRELVDHGEQPQEGPAHGEDGHECTCHGETGHECRYENKYEKVVGELDELRADYTPIVLNRGKAKEVTVLLAQSRGSFDTPLAREAELSTAQRVALGWLTKLDDNNAVHVVTGEIVPL